MFAKVDFPVAISPIISNNFFIVFSPSDKLELIKLFFIEIIQFCNSIYQ